MRNAFVPVAAAVAIFIAGIFILNIQLWYSARADSQSGARYAVSDINDILDEARVAARTATEIIVKGCDAEGQYQLGTEAALQPHLRTIAIIRQGQPWCSSLPGNRVLLRHINTLPDTPLFLVPASDTVNGQPVLLFQTRFAENRIIVTISDRHIRDALSTPLKHVNYSLAVGGSAIDASGELHVTSPGERQARQVYSEQYAYSIRYNPAPFSARKGCFIRGAAYSFSYCWLPVSRLMFCIST